MKKLLLSAFILLSLSGFAQNKWIYVNSRVSGTNITFELFKKQPDNSYALVETGISTGNYLFDSLNAGIYRFHMTIAYTKYIPTWHPRKALWEEAADIDLTVTDSFTSEDGLLPNPVFTGPASILGEMTEGILKTAGDPLKNIRVLIVDNSEQLIKMVNTNDSGKFTAANLPVGTYKIKTDIINAVNANPKSVTLDSSHLTADVKLTVSKNGTSNTGIKVPTVAKAATTVYPNPSNGLINITVGGTAFNYSIYSVTGKLIRQAAVAGNHATVDLQQQNPGMYFIQVEQNGKTEIKRITLVQ